jgi:hypothetical protein
MINDGINCEFDRQEFNGDRFGGGDDRCKLEPLQ